MTDQWFVCETKFRREREATEEIEALGFTCFRPIEFRRKQDRSHKARPIMEYEVAMFPRYIFPKFDIKTPCGWQHIGRLRSVKGWLKPSIASDPSPIRDDFIDRVREEQIATKAALAGDLAIRALPLLLHGTRVRITEGPFASLGGFISMSAVDRVKVMLDAAGFTALEIARRSVVAA